MRNQPQVLLYTTHYMNCIIYIILKFLNKIIFIISSNKELLECLNQVDVYFFKSIDFLILCYYVLCIIVLPWPALSRYHYTSLYEIN